MHNRSIAAALLCALILGCAPYRQLKPRTPLTPQEGGYLELRRDDNRDFKLGRNKKYFVWFPPAEHDHFYLVLAFAQKGQMHTLLTDVYERKTIGAPIEDHSADVDTQSVYPIGTREGGYYWLIENGPAEQELSVRYRYTPQWRFTFENKHAQYARELDDNRVDRTIYTTLGESFRFNDFAFAPAINEVTTRLANLDGLHQQLLALESLFPPSIINSTDQAYLDFNKLKNELEDEMKFQDNYLAVLTLFAGEAATRGNTAGFMERLPDFVRFFRQDRTLPPPITREIQSVLGNRIREIAPFYAGLLRAKDDARPFDPVAFRIASLPSLDTLSSTAAIPLDGETTLLLRFMRDFERTAATLKEVTEGLDAIEKQLLEGADPLPRAGHFDSAVRYTQAFRGQLPAPLDHRYGEYANLRCTRHLNDALGRMSTTVAQRLSQYQTAQGVLGQLLMHQQQREYPEMLALLKPYAGMDVLMQLYRPLDTLSLAEQQLRIRTALEEGNWPVAERRLSSLHGDQSFIDPASIYPRKYAAVMLLEDSLLTRINRVSRRRVLHFLENNVDSVENVEALYSDSVWVPAYTLTFTSGERSDLARRNQELADYLTRLKEHEFPERAIKLLYDQFIKNPDDNGILKARAIVVHGEQYKGEDKTTRRRAAEVNPWAAKWITEAGRYRNLYVVPLTSSARGENRYFFRINIRIPTDAKFPVYDVNIKLPPEIARGAAAQQWYESITLNKKELRNEGRFTISAPTAENNYECRITPMRVESEGSNLLDVTFRHNSYKVHTISVMVQEPLIRKN